MSASWNRRGFLRQVATTGIAAGLCASSEATRADKEPAGQPDSAGVLPTSFPKVPDHTLMIITGKPRERGKQYGAKFKDAIHAFLDREILRPFVKQPSPREAMLRYAGACGRAVQNYSPILGD